MWEPEKYANNILQTAFWNAFYWLKIWTFHSKFIIGAKASPITSLTIVNSTVHSGADQRKHQNSASLAFVRGIHQWLVNSPHKWPVARKIFPFDDVIMSSSNHDDIIKGKIFCITALFTGNSPATDEFPSQCPVTWSFAVAFDLRLNKGLSKQLRCWLLEKPSAHFGVTVMDLSCQRASLGHDCLKVVIE